MLITKIWRVMRWLLLIGLCLFVSVQFIGPAKTNPVIDQSSTLEAHLNPEPKMAAILDRSCNDCHSSKTQWPWYASVAPMSWLVIDHVNHGRSHLNFSEWGTYDKDRQEDLIREMCKLVKDGEMPLSSYTPLHPESKLTGEDVKVICDWANEARKRVKKH